MLDSTSFASSPLITPERLHADPAGCLLLAPAWALSWGLAVPDLPVEDNVLVFAVQAPGEVRSYAMCPMAGAFLFETTRYGGNVVPNSRKKAANPDAPWYLKLTVPGATKDNVTVQRIVVDAQPHEAVTPDRNPGELRAMFLSKQRSRPASKSARKIALAHAERQARKHGVDPGPYLANLGALLVLHDRINGMVVSD